MTPRKPTDRLNYAMDLTYFKRYRMEIDLAGRDLTPAKLPSEYRCVAWQPAPLEAFAEAKYLSFRGNWMPTSSRAWGTWTAVAG